MTPNGSLNHTMTTPYSPLDETHRIFNNILTQFNVLNLRKEITALAQNVHFVSSHNKVYFPIPLKETETTAAFKGLEGCVAAALAGLKEEQLVNGEKNGVNGTVEKREMKITVDLEKATVFLFQTYISTIDGLGKLDKRSRSKLNGLSHLPLSFRFQVLGIFI